jgi:hypothetical protein
MPSNQTLDPFDWIATLDDYLYPFADLVEVDYLGEEILILSSDRSIMAQRVTDFYRQHPETGFRLVVVRNRPTGRQVWFDSIWIERKVSS